MKFFLLGVLCLMTTRSTVLAQNTNLMLVDAAALAQQFSDIACEGWNNQPDCAQQDGCAWCYPNISTRKSGVSGMSSITCLPWRMCSGFSCEARRDKTTCLEYNAPSGSAVDDAADSLDSRCIWCSSQERCFNGSKDDDGIVIGRQCLGCDGLYDSGVKNDLCGTCGGVCQTLSTADTNPSCKCARCPHQVDLCGVCGGDNSTCDRSLFFTQQEFIGITLALCGNLLISGSLTIQKYAHNKNKQDPRGLQPYVQLPSWWAGTLLMTLGETGNFLAYAYAPATLVAPLGAVSVISNSILAYYALGEELNAQKLLGVLLAIVGSVLIVVYAPSSDKQLTMEVLESYMAEPSFIAFVAGILAALAALFLYVRRRKSMVAYILVCSLSGSLTVMSVKGISTAMILTFQGQSQLNRPLPWILILTAIATLLVQLRFLNLAMHDFDVSAVVPVYYVLFTLSSIFSGIVLYKEFHQHCPEEGVDCHATLFFLLGCAVTFAGVYLIAVDRRIRPLVALSAAGSLAAVAAVAAGGGAHRAGSETEVLLVPLEEGRRRGGTAGGGAGGDDSAVGSPGSGLAFSDELGDLDDLKGGESFEMEGGGEGEKGSSLSSVSTLKAPAAGRLSAFVAGETSSRYGYDGL